MSGDRQCLISKISDPTAEPAAAKTPPPGRTTASDTANIGPRCGKGLVIRATIEGNGHCPSRLLARRGPSWGAS
jgi:hypothetical protein